ncbi:hypothetical protein LY78DRAFT_664005 [Colletotrichum sublineola]|nr:hypothetical protein LY78DRAFT_664005 [Colletotrichum sublineola]
MPSDHPRRPMPGDRTLEHGVERLFLLVTKILTAAVVVLAIRSIYIHLQATETRAPLLPRQHPSQPSMTTVRICTALHALRALEPDQPSRAPMPFEFLHLDPRAAPFHPPRDAARIGSKNHSAVLKAVIKAGQKSREMLYSMLPRGGSVSIAAQEQTKADLTLRASWAVTGMLLDDEARTYFLEHIQPRLYKLRTAIDAIEGLCGQLWRERQWES